MAIQNIVTLIHIRGLWVACQSLFATQFVLVANPIGIVDHLQFGNPENEQIFWTFLESIKAIRDFCNIYENSSSGWKSKSL